MLMEIKLVKFFEYLLRVIAVMPCGLTDRVTNGQILRD